MTGQSRSQVQKLISRGLVRVNTVAEKKCRVLAAGDAVSLEAHEVELPDLEPREADFGVLHEDGEFLVVDKPAGLSVHPAPGQRMTTLVHGLLHRSITLSASGNPWRPGIVHRLDRFTSGLLLVAKTPRAHTALAAQFARGEVTKEYLAVMEGVVEHDESRVESPIARDRIHRERMAPSPAGKSALTFFRVLERFKRHTHVSAHPATGRRHQIRVHARLMGHPLVADAVYGQGPRPAGPASVMTRQALHARSLRFLHPVTGAPLHFVSEIPPDFAALLGALRQDGT